MCSQPNLYFYAQQLRLSAKKSLGNENQTIGLLQARANVERSRPFLSFIILWRYVESWTLLKIHRHEIFDLSWISFPLGPDSVVKLSHFEFLYTYAEVFNSKSWSLLSTTPVIKIEKFKSEFFSVLWEHSLEFSSLHTAWFFSHLCR